MSFNNDNLVNADKCMQSNNIKRYAAIDVMKVICSFLVIMIHFRPCVLGSVADKFLIGYIANIAVPFFFVCSGYFCFKKADTNDGFNINTINRYALRMLKLYTIWVLIYMLYSLVSGNGISITDIKDYLIGYGHLWFLKALAVAIFLCGILRHKNISTKNILYIAGIIYVFGTIWENIYPIIFETSYPIYYSRSGIFNALLFVAIGAFFANTQINVNKIFSFYFGGGTCLLMVR